MAFLYVPSISNYVLKKLQHQYNTFSFKKYSNSNSAVHSYTFFLPEESGEGRICYHSSLQSRNEQLAYWGKKDDSWTGGKESKEFIYNR